jgi:hypothetical protein
MTFTKTIFLLAAIPLLFGSCRKTEDKDKDTLPATDATLAEEVFIDTHLLCDEAGYKNGAFTGILSAPCVNVSYDSLNPLDEDSITIDFGTIGCKGYDSIPRKGKILIRFTGNYADSNVSHTVTMNNYYFDGDRVNGSFTVLNKGRDSVSGHLMYHIDASGSLTTFKGQINWWSSKDLEWYAGESSPAWDDNEYIVTGFANGSQALGLPFVSQINSPLLRSLAGNCRKHFKQGQLQVKPNEKLMRTIDYGTGGCDSDATVIIDGETYSVVLE